MGRMADEQKRMEQDANLIGDLYRSAEMYVNTLREALRELAAAAVTDCEPNGCPFEPGDFQEYVLRMSTAALGHPIDAMDAAPDADGGFNGEPVDAFDFTVVIVPNIASLAEAFLGGEPEGEHDGDHDTNTDSRYCADCDGPCALDNGDHFGLR